MRPSFGSCEMNDDLAPSLDLTLPDGADFHSFPPQVSLALVSHRSHELRRWFPYAVRGAQERWQAKTTDEFRL